MHKKEEVMGDDPLWYKDAIIYELHVKAFYDKRNDGIGNFKGLAEKLDYLERLGVTALWLLPFYPSPLRDDGYDIADYYNIHPQYGNLRDFKVFLREAHNRGIKVITEVVLNHTSDQHAWFQKARQAKPNSSHRDFYVWSDTTEKYKDARVIFQDFENSNWTWDPVARAYFWHRFYSHQPDLNYDNPQVQKAVIKIVDYWLNMGVDGLRLDAVPYLYQREGTSCENLKETYDFLKKLRAHVDSSFKNKMFLAEANQWPEDAVAYFGNGDSCHMAYHFPVMPRIFMAVQMEDRFPIVDILDQTPAIPEVCQWAMFLRNHDELTLEMVTDEERDYMYKVYAKERTARLNVGIRRRLAPLLNNDRNKIEIMNVLLFSLPGTPVIYYGDEIGMGDNYYLGDRNGVRTPMQWSADRNAGFSKANPHKLYLPVIIDPDYHFSAVNVENQERNQGSLLWWMKRIIAMRKHFKAFGRGSIEFLFPDNYKVLAFIRKYDDEIILVIVNLSRFSQFAEIDLSLFSGYIPYELFSRSRFPLIKDTSYLITLGGYGYYFFLLKKEEETTIKTEKARIDIGSADNWKAIFQGKILENLEGKILPAYLQSCRWFGAKARTIIETKITENIVIGENVLSSHLLFLEIRYAEGTSDLYLLPMTFVSGEDALKIAGDYPQAVIAQLKSIEGEGIIVDAVYNKTFQKNILTLIARRQRIRGLEGTLTAHTGQYFKTYNQGKKVLPFEESRILKAEQSNTSFLYGQEFYLKLYRRLDEGTNPDIEIERFLTEKKSFPHIPPFVGEIEYKKNGREPMSLGILEKFIPNHGDAWPFTLDEIERYFERVLARRGEIDEIPPTIDALSQWKTVEETPSLVRELIGQFYLEMAGRLGKRTAELHLALASDLSDQNFAPEPFTVYYQRSLYQSLRSLTSRNLQLLRKNIRKLPDNIRDKAEEIVNREKEILDTFEAVIKNRIRGNKIRIHGDYHLGQVLFTGNDFIIIDFEGEPARPLSERKIKRSALRDVAGMIRSFHYAAYTGLFKQESLKKEYASALDPWADIWYQYVVRAFLRSYFNELADSSFIPQEPELIGIMLNAFVLDKAVYEIGYELNNRPDWVIIPIKGILGLLSSS
jgi:maltose alpha-D-glucosyltransferase/alpha-amylase